jgi:hypothetical protein
MRALFRFGITSTRAMRRELDTLMRQRDELTRHIDALARTIERREFEASGLMPKAHKVLIRAMASPNQLPSGFPPMFAAQSKSSRRDI